MGRQEAHEGLPLDGTLLEEGKKESEGNELEEKDPGDPANHCPIPPPPESPTDSDIEDQQQWIGDSNVEWSGYPLHPADAKDAAQVGETPGEQKDRQDPQVHRDPAVFQPLSNPLGGFNRISPFCFHND